MIKHILGCTKKYEENPKKVSDVTKLLTLSIAASVASSGSGLLWPCCSWCNPVQ